LNCPSAQGLARRPGRRDRTSVLPTRLPFTAIGRAARSDGAGSPPNFKRRERPPRKARARDIVRTDAEKDEIVVGRDRGSAIGGMSGHRALAYQPIASAHSPAASAGLPEPVGQAGPRGSRLPQVPAEPRALAAPAG